jgi:hypothetical protein
MKHPLDGARLKVVRAQKHLKTLKDEIAGYLRTDPHEFPVEHDGNAVTAREAVIKADRQSPDELSCVVGECVEPLRHALDYIAWELATKFAVSAPVVGKDEGIYFPILDAPTGDSADRFDKMAKKYTFGADAVKLIKDVQPYVAGYEPLKLLAALTNRDKHCLPLLTVAYVNTALIELSVVGQSPDMCRTAIAGRNAVSVSVRSLPATETGPVTEIAAVFDMLNSDGKVFQVTAAVNTADPGGLEQKPGSVKVDGQVSVFVSLKDGAMPLVPVERELEKIVKCVADILPRFEQFF